jgi:hypothetical protein
MLCGSSWLFNPAKSVHVFISFKTREQTNLMNQALGFGVGPTESLYSEEYRLQNEFPGRLRFNLRLAFQRLRSGRARVLSAKTFKCKKDARKLRLSPVFALSFGLMTWVF